MNFKGRALFIVIDKESCLCHIVVMARKMAQIESSDISSLRHWLDQQVNAAQVGRDVPMTVQDIETAWATRFKASEIEDAVIPRRTLARRKANSTRLTHDEADRAVRLARIQLEADRVFASQDRASRWLRTPNQRIAGQTPLSVIRTEAGAMIVSEILGQIDHGMYA